MNRTRLTKRRLCVEQLEGRLVLSAVSPLPALTSGPLCLSLAAGVKPSAVTPVTSGNWSGYVAETKLIKPASNVVTDVSGTWVVPAITTTSTAASSCMVGIDGWSTNSVEEIGTAQGMYLGQTAISYSAWYEMWTPSTSHWSTITAMTVNPGDQMHAEVKYLGSNKFKLTIKDITENQSFSTTQTLKGAKRSSAEWLVTAPSDAATGDEYPLANFGTVPFTQASATINGKKGSISNKAWQTLKVNMVSSDTTMDQTSALSSNGTSFSVAWTSDGLSSILQKKQDDAVDQLFATPKLELFY